MLSISPPPARAPPVVLSRSSPPPPLSPFGSSLVSSSIDSFVKDGRKIRAGDCALFQAGDAPPFIGIIRCFSTDKENCLKLCVNWLYRPAEIKLPKGILLEAAPNEVFYSFHKDVIAAVSLLHPCKVAFLRKGVELPSGISSFICRRVYDIENKCLWWLTDQDYISERQEEVDKLLDRTRLEMHAAVQSGGRSPKPFNGPTSSQQLKSSSDSVQNSGTSSSQASKGKKRERSSDRGTEPIKRGERSSNKAEDVESASSRVDNTIKSELAKITEKGALISIEGCEKLVYLMKLDRNEKKIDLVNRILLADVIAGTDKIECLSRIVQLRGIPILDDWLQGAHKGKTGDVSSHKDSDKGTEELLFALLRALDKLPVDLNTLQTCNIGKSVNHLRSHKNLEIQKKARTLVDTWKKRVDAEMTKIDAKSGGPTNQPVTWPANQTVTWPAKPGPGLSDVPHSGSKATTKTHISQPSVSNKPLLNNKLGHVEAIVKSTPVTTGPLKLPSSTPLPSPGKGGVSGSGNHSELPIVTATEEKSSNSSPSSDHGKTLGSSLKEDARSSTAVSLSASKTSGSSSRHRRSINGHVGNSITGVQKDSNLAKTVKGTNQSGLSSDSTHDTHGSDHGNNHRLIVRIPNPGRSPAQSTSGGSVEDPSTTGSRASSPCVPNRYDHNDKKVKLKDDAFRSHISTDVNAESWQSNVAKEGIVGSDEGNGSPLADLDEELEKTLDSSSGNEKRVSSLVKIKKRNSLFALMDNAKDSEPSAPLSSGDNIGMNLLASVAEGEMSSKSDLVSVSPSAPPGNSEPRIFCEAGAAKSCGQSVNNAYSESEKQLVVSEKLNEISRVEVKSEDIKEEELENNLAHPSAMEKIKPSDHTLEKITEGTSKPSNLVGNSMGDNCRTDFQNLVIEKSSSFPPTMNEEHKPVIRENNAGAAEGICGSDSTPSTPEEVPCLKTYDASKSKRSDNSEENHLDPCESEQEKLGTCAPASNDQQSGTTSNSDDTGLERKDAPENHLASSVQEAEKCSKSDLDRREEFTTSEQDILGSKLDFDLNEGFLGDDGNHNQIELTVSSVAPVCSPPVHLLAVPSFASGPTPNGSSAPITIAAPNKGSFVPPENLLKNKGEHFGWKGSAATSAFRPAEPRRVLVMPPCNISDAHSSDSAIAKQGRPPIEIDLNVADEMVLEDMASSPGSHTTISVSGVGSNHAPPKRSAGGLDLDLNKVDEGTDTGQFLGSASSKKPFPGGLHNGDANLFRGFDLNNGSGIDEIVRVEPLPKSQHVKNFSSSMPRPPPVAGLRMGNNAEIGNISSWFPHGNSCPAVPISSFLHERGAQHPYPIVAAPGAQGILGSVSGSISGDVYSGPVLSSAPAIAFSPATPFPCAGFPFRSNFSLPSSSYSGGSTVYVDSSQLVGTGNAVSSHYVRPYILSHPEGCMNAGSESNWKWGGRGLDLNAGSSVMGVVDVKDDRLPSASTQLPLPSFQMFGEEQARMYQVSGGGGVKRKEREGGVSWDLRF